MSRKKAVAAPPREPTRAERDAIESAKAKQRARPVRPELAASAAGGVLTLASPHSDARGGALLMQEALGSVSDPFINKSMTTLANALGATPDDIGHALAIIAAVEPADELQSALAQQMAVTHALSLKMATRASGAQTVEAMNAYGNLAVKFSRTFTAQIEALGKLRNGGAQIVRHVHVYPGGQAVVADEFHHHLGGQDARTDEQSHAPCEPRAALLRHDSGGNVLPLPGCQEPEAVPDARRRQPRRSARQSA